MRKDLHNELRNRRRAALYRERKIAEGVAGVTRRCDGDTLLTTSNPAMQRDRALLDRLGIEPFVGKSAGNPN